MSSGYLYILINPAMPGLSKVGKTTRDPSTRVAELSSATGVPSPFILAFQRQVADCNFAENWVHKELERKGQRLANNREFFSAPLHEIVELVMQTTNMQPPERESLSPSLSEVSSSSEMAEQLYELGTQCLNGSSTVLANPMKAKELFEQAAALNHPNACSHLGIMYHHGLQIKQDHSRALDFYNKAIRLGEWRVQTWVAQLFLDAGQKEAAESHWFAYFERVTRELSALNFDELDDRDKNFLIQMDGARGARYLELVANHEIAECVSRESIKLLAPYISTSIDRSIKELNATERHRDVSVQYMTAGLKSARRQLQKVLAS